MGGSPGGGQTTGPPHAERAVRTCCPACATAGSRPAASVRGYSFRRCRSCRSLFVAEPPSEEAVAPLYADERYFARGRLGAQPGEVFGYRDYLADREHIERKFERILARMERHAPPGRLLDVGAGPGLMLSAARRRGWSPAGVELNGWAVAYGRARLGVPIRAGTLGAARFPSGAFDAVTMMDVLEHVPAPATLVAEAARVTRPGGVLAVLTPDAAARASRLLGARWPELLRVPAHLVLFSAGGLARLLARHGYEVVGRHSVGKTSTVATLLADASPALPAAARALEPLLARGPLARRKLKLDARTKVCVYARRLGSAPS